MIDNAFIFIVGPDGLPRSSADAEFGPASAYKRNKKKEPRRHTLANGIDYNTVSFFLPNST